MRYDPETAPNPDEWLSLDEAQRIDLASAHHRRMRAKLPNVRLHAAVHIVVENQLAEGLDDVSDAMARLRAEGLSRHDAIHAIGWVLIGHIGHLMRGKGKGVRNHLSERPEGRRAQMVPDPLVPHAPYLQALRSLTARSWRERTGMARQTIPPGTTLPVALTLRERDLIRDQTFYNLDFAKCAVVDGTGIRVDLSLDDIEEIQGYVAAEANHTNNAKLRKELDRLFAKFQVLLDTYDDQSE
jgi:hypothetical protein